MEIDITDFLDSADMIDYSASVAELGRDAARITWRNAVEDSAAFMVLDTDEKRDAWRDTLRSMGAWEESDIKLWADLELNALFLQFVAGDVREEERGGERSGRLSGVNTDGCAYFILGE